MTVAYITIDTEYSAMFAQRGRAEAFARSIACETAGGEVGIAYQMNVFDRHGIKAVFFVDPMPALLWGVEAIADVVGPIVARGHDVQLHLHTEWLALAGANNPLGDHTGPSIANFDFEDQCRLIDHARDEHVAAFTIVSHSFELMSRDRTRINQIVKRRFDRFCAGLARLPGVKAVTYADAPPMVAPIRAVSVPPAPVLPASIFRTGRRHAEQAVANALYDGR
jgi:hypothetical protein